MSEIKKCDLFSKQTRHGQTRPSREDMLDAIRQVAEDFFSDEASDYSDIVLLLDGLNEVLEGIRQTAETQFAQQLRRVNRVVVTTRPHCLSPTPKSVTEFELCELSGEQITEYLSRALKDGEHIFDTQIKNDARILSMARNPFYLSLLVERINEDPNVSIPQNRALLIKDFVHRAMQRKRKEAITLSDHVIDNLLFVVLPCVAKWSLESITQSDTAGPRPFHQSSQFRDIQDSSGNIFEALRIAEKYGLLKSSGLPAAFHESGDYPEFVHDNVRDYFAALNLRALDEFDFIRTLSERFEYFVWDEPMLLFLELNSNEQLFRDIIEFILPSDVILASMCVRHAPLLEHDLCLVLESRIRHSAIYQRMAPLLPEDILKEYSRPLIRNLSVYILSRLPTHFLLDMAQNSDDNDPLKADFWISLAQNITQDDLVLLEDLWRSLPKDDIGNRFYVFTTICKIPSYDAFKRVVKIYKEWRINPDDSEPARFTDSCLLTLISYSPSLSELIAEFPLETSLEEFIVLLKKVTKVSSEELPLLKKLIFSNDSSISIDACKLLARSNSKESLPILLKRFNTPINNQGPSTLST